MGLNKWRLFTSSPIVREGADSVAQQQQEQQFLCLEKERGPFLLPVGSLLFPYKEKADGSQEQKTFQIGSVNIWILFDLGRRHWVVFDLTWDKLRPTCPSILRVLMCWRWGDLISEINFVSMKKMI